jgi:hypothetical protein
MQPTAGASQRPSWTLLATIAGFAIVTVYCSYQSICMIEAATGAVVEHESLKQYREALAGVAEFPYRWRVLGIYLVRAGERATGASPHVVDVVLKTLLLFASSTILFVFSRQRVSEIGALCAVAFYQLTSAIGFSDHYRIYFTNDYVMIACWFAAVYCVSTERYRTAALVTFVGAWAKETMLLVPLLVALRRLHGHARNRDVALALIAFLVPTAVLRVLYPAPLAKWAWWETIFLNVPLLQLSRRTIAIAVQSNLKAFLLFNALWIVAARFLFKAAKGTLTRDLALTGVAYLVLIYPVVIIRELRHFLPLAIIVLPFSIAKLEGRPPG